MQHCIRLATILMFMGNNYHQQHSKNFHALILLRDQKLNYAVNSKQELEPRFKITLYTVKVVTETELVKI